MGQGHGEEQRFQQLIESLPTVAVQGYNSNREVIYWNDASASLYGYSKTEALGQRLEDLIIPVEMRAEVIAAHLRWIESGIEIPATELKLRHKAGHYVHVFSSHVMLKQDTDDPEMFCVDIDLSEQHRAAKQLETLATLDSLTELPNRRYLERELECRISEAGRFCQPFAVLFIDLDIFKEINDTMGHQAGDKILRQVSKRLKKHLRQYDTLSRFGGDEFVILLPRIKGRNCIQVVADKVISEFDKTFQLHDQDIYLTASIGVSVYPDDGETVSELLKNADAAMYQAKAAGGNGYRFFARSMSQHLLRQRKVATGLRQSLEKGEFQLVFQPQIKLRTGTIDSCEALLRWRPSNKNLAASPGEFIPIAERSDLIVRLGDWVLNAACQQLAAWRALGIDNLRVDINVSGRQLCQTLFFERFDTVVRKYGLQCSDIGIELTENVLIDADDDILAKLKQFKLAGMEISIDDFGTGFSSLSYLKHFPVQTLKIDRSFVKEAPNSTQDKAIMEAIVQVGHKLNMKILVEGIETVEQRDFCYSLGCDIAQGYYYHKPLSPDEMYQFLISGSSTETVNNPQAIMP